MINRMNRGRLEQHNNCSCKGLCQGFNASHIQSNNSGDCIKGSLLKKLQIIDFSILETALYLDAYPNCQRALAHYHKLIEERGAILIKLDEAGIPLTNSSNTANCWNWTSSPWPWEYEANI